MKELKKFEGECKEEPGPERRAHGEERSLILCVRVRISGWPLPPAAGLES